ncbi:hypothetical protein CRG98_009932 [Punica granatum]|uniref:Retrotransposon gag domain-containing protein n=1 Tax=Punica granatum TaxID=22663 RepID=A0A2I0KME8_PUNGR|nr:hypothetical protein CRG98_009932 [Punica granatum]
MLQYWDYEEFIIQTFQDSLTGSVLDWFMTLKSVDIPIWTDLSQKFLDQYRFCAKTPPTILDLSMMEIKEERTFEAYAADWQGKAAKHIPQLLSDNKVDQSWEKFDMGIKLGRIEGLANKKEGEASKKHAAGTSRKGKDATVTAVNPGRQALQQFSMSYTPTPPASQAYAHLVHYIQPY